MYLAELVGCKNKILYERGVILYERGVSLQVKLRI